MARLQGKLALLMGATSGIGRATAIAFAREGASLVLAGRREAAGRETLRRYQAASSAPPRGMRMRRLALGAALLAALSAPTLAPAAQSSECAMALNPPLDQRFSDRTETMLSLEEYLGSSYTGAVEPARPYWLGGCRTGFRLAGGYRVSSSVGRFANDSAAESIRRLRATGVVMDNVERSLAEQIARGALVTRGSLRGTQVLAAVWRRGPALLTILVLADPGTPLPTKTLTIFTKLLDARATKALRR